MARQTFHAALFFAILLGLSMGTGCSDDNEGRLQGSVGSVYDLSFDDVRARLYTSELAIEYHRENGEVPVRITLRVGDEEFTTGTYDLAEAGDITGRSRGVDIPRLVSGKITLENYAPTAGAKVKGEFEAVVRSGGDRLTLTGEFNSRLEIVKHGYPDIIDVGSDAPDTSGRRPSDAGPIVPDIVIPPREDTSTGEPDTPAPQEDTVVVEDIVTEPDVPQVEDVTPDVPPPVEDTGPDVTPVEDTGPDVIPVEDTGPDIVVEEDTGPDATPDVSPPEGDTDVEGS